jgi:phosphoserine phosphatase RsbU/P
LDYQRILIIEDDEYIQNLIRQGSGGVEYQLIWASNQAETKLHLLEDASLGAVIISAKICDTDYKIIQDIRQLNPYIRIIIIADSWDLNSVRKAMNSGVFDYLIRPLDVKELRGIINKAIEQSFSRISAAKTRQKLLSLQRDLEIAGEVQNYILPEAFVELNGCMIHARMIPTRSIGGDFYDYFLIDNCHIGIVIGDVSGKGIPAALFMAMTRSLIKMTALTGVTPNECLKQVNIALSAENPSYMFATVFYAILDSDSSELTYCNAGHNSPYLINKDGRLSCLPRTGNMALGFDKNADYNCRKIEINPDHVLFLYTDGVTEAADLNNNMFGEKRLEEILGNIEHIDSDKLLPTILEDLNNFSSGTAQSDDITMLALSLVSAPANINTEKINNFSFTLQNNLEQIIVLQKHIDKYCQQNNLTFTVQHAIEISLEELFTNITNYAFSDKNKHLIQFEFTIMNSLVRIVIKDNGLEFDPTVVIQRQAKTSLEQSKIGGWGLQIVHKYMDNLTYQRKENFNTLTLTKKI